MKNDDYINNKSEEENKTANLGLSFNPNDPNFFNDDVNNTKSSFKSLMSDDMRELYLNEEINKLDNNDENKFDEDGNFINKATLPTTSTLNKPKKNNFLANKRNLFAALTAIFIVVSTAIYFILTSPTDEERRLNEIFDPNKLVVVKYDSKYGYIKTNGKKVLNPVYTYATPFYGKYAIVSTDTKEEDEKKTYQIIDKKGKVKKEVYSALPKYYAAYSIWNINGVLYDANLKELTSPEKNYIYLDYGYFYSSTNTGFDIIDYKIKPIYSESTTKKLTIEIFPNSKKSSNYYIMVSSTDGTSKIINLNTKKTVYNTKNPTEEYLKVKSSNIFETLSKKDNKHLKWSYLEDDKVLYETPEALSNLSFYNYDNKILELDYGTDYNLKGKDKRYIYYDIKNKKVLEDKPNPINLEFSSMEDDYGYRLYSCDNTMGLNKDGKKITECFYDKVTFLNKDIYDYMSQKKNMHLVLLEQDNKTYLTDLKTKKTLITFDTTTVYDNGNTTFLVGAITNPNTKKTSYLIYNLLTGKTLSTSESEYVTIKSNYVIVFNTELENYYNTKLERIYTSRLK